MNVYLGVICLKQPIFWLPLGDPLRQVWLYMQVSFPTKHAEKSFQLQKNFSGSNTYMYDSFTTAVLNSFLSTLEKNLIAADIIIFGII